MNNMLTLHSFWLGPESYTLFQVTEIDQEKKTVKIQEVANSDIYNSVDDFMSVAFDTYGHEAVPALEKIRADLESMPEGWKVSTGTEIILPIDCFFANRFELLQAETVAEAVEFIRGMEEAAEMQDMVDKGIMGFGGPMFGDFAQ